MNRDSDRDIERYVSTGVLMDVLEISRSTVYRLMAKGVPSIMVGSVHRFPINQVLTWLEDNYPSTKR
jgi:excisionase family DNA binding protein